jgi:hypothetical protein
VKNQIDPSEDSGGGPFLFRIHSGFLPSGLVLHSNGLLTGTVSSINRLSRPWPFTVCVTDFRHSSIKARCDSATITVETKAKPKPKPTPTPTPTPTASVYKGSYTGALTGTVTWATTQGPTTEKIDIPVDIGGVSEDNFNPGVFYFVADNACDATYSDCFTIGDGQGTSNQPEVPASGLVAMSFVPELDISPPPNLNISETYLGAAGSCHFSMQFTKSGSAASVGTISCQGESQRGTAATFTGTLSLTRTP